MDHTDPDSVYFERRASEETAAAERAADERARQLHIELAQRYANAARSRSPAGSGAETDELPNGRSIAAEFRILG